MNKKKELATLESPVWMPDTHGATHNILRTVFLHQSEIGSYDIKVTKKETFN